MFGQYQIVAGVGYLSINHGGTMVKLPKLKWYWEAWFLVVSAFREVHLNEIRRVYPKGE